MKPRFTKEEHEILDKTLGKTDHDFDSEKEGYFYFTCKCGKSEHTESIINNRRTIVCDQCGENYYNVASRLQELEEEKNK